jgi:hypothetical protein
MEPALLSVLLPLPLAGEGWGEGGSSGTTLTPTLSHEWERE